MSYNSLTPSPANRTAKPWQRRDPSMSQQVHDRSRTRTGLRIAIGFLVVIWGVHLINVLTGGWMTYYGIHPLDPSSLWHIATSPLLHADFNHLISNSIPGAIFCFLIGMSGKRVFWEVTLIAAVIGGLGTWLLGGVGTNHIGASGLIYGWLGYLLVRGLFNRDFKQIALGVVLAFIYSSLFWGILPIQAGVSWQGHLFGAAGGIAAGAFITSDDPKALRAKKEQKALERQRRRH